MKCARSNHKEEQTRNAGVHERCLQAVVGLTRAFRHAVAPSQKIPRDAGVVERRQRQVAEFLLNARNDFQIVGLRARLQAAKILARLVIRDDGKERAAVRLAARRNCDQPALRWAPQKPIDAPGDDAGGRPRPRMYQRSRAAASPPTRPSVVADRPATSPGLELILCRTDRHEWRVVFRKGIRRDDGEPG